MADTAVPVTPPPLPIAESPTITPATASVASRHADRPTIAGYLLEDRLGSGGMGSVWRARQLSVGRAVALKLLDPQLARGAGFAERFMREARAAASIAHPHVCACFDAGCDDGRYYLALELIPGGDVTRLIHARGGRLAPREAVQIARDCARGLEAVAAAQLIHRDIKPANIFLTADPRDGGIAKLGDFGLARPTGPSAHLTHTGAALGTPAYMAPEQARGERAIDIRADIYALGASLFEMLTGSPPFTGETAYAIVSQVLIGPTPDPRHQVRTISPAISAVVMRAMGRTPAERYGSARELREDLDAVLEGQLPLAFQKSVGANLATGLLSRTPSPRPGAASTTPSTRAAPPAPAVSPAAVPAPERVRLPLPVIAVGAAAVACTIVLLIWHALGHHHPVTPPPAPVAAMLRDPTPAGHAPAPVRPAVPSSTAPAATFPMPATAVAPRLPAATTSATAATPPAHLRAPARLRPAPASPAPGAAQVHPAAPPMATAAHLPAPPAVPAPAAPAPSSTAGLTLPPPAPSPDAILPAPAAAVPAPTASTPTLDALPKPSTVPGR